MRIRRSARAIVINKREEILLFRFEFADLKGDKKEGSNNVLWITPGGGLEENETFMDCLARELREETGIELNQEYPWVATKEAIFEKDGEKFISHERYFFVEIEENSVILDGMTANEKRRLRDYKWWKLDDICNSSEEFRPEDLGNLVTRLKQKIPVEPVIIS